NEKGINIIENEVRENGQLDGTDREIDFKVRQMMSSTDKGQFKNFEVNVQNPNDDLYQGQVEVKIEVDSIDTKNEQRDQHLKRSDFFDGATNQYITFQSTKDRKSTRLNSS